MIYQPKEDANICIDCQTRLGSILSSSQYSDIELHFLERPRRTITAAIPVRMDDGSIRTFNAYRVQYSDARGPGKGGIRFHHEVNLTEVKNLAFLMALKCALIDIPFGGAKGGVEVDVSEISLAEKERLARGFVREFYHVIGDQVDIPAPDMNTDEATMAWMVDEYSRLAGKQVPGVVTGKPAALGGSAGRTEATAYGGASALQAYYQHCNDTLAGKTVAIQGFGNVGAHLATILENRGARIVAISDSKQAVHNPAGLSIATIRAKQDHGTLPADIDGESIDNQALLELSVDVLVPAAVSHQITVQNANKIAAAVVLEMANDPVTPDADTILQENGVVVLPDVLANAGGVLVSYFEWVQNSNNLYWPKERVNKELTTRIEKAFKVVATQAQEDYTALRPEAYRLAVDRIIVAERLRGRL